LNKTIIVKVKAKGTAAKLNELLRYSFHFSEDERISLREKITISAETIATPYWDKPGVVIMLIALLEIALEDTTLDEIILDNNIIIPSNRKHYLLAHI
jgi:hypothetical protein